MTPIDLEGLRALVRHVAVGPLVIEAQTLKALLAMIPDPAALRSAAQPAAERVDRFAADDHDVEAETDRPAFPAAAVERIQRCGHCGAQLPDGKHDLCDEFRVADDARDQDAAVERAPHGEAGGGAS